MKNYLCLSLLAILLLTNCSNLENNKNEIIVTKAIMQVKSEFVNEFKKIAADVVHETLKENGCLNYVFYQDISDSTKFFLYEEYVDQKALDYHLSQPYLVEFRKARKSMIVGDIPYTIYYSKVKHSTAISPKNIEVELDIK